MFGERMHKIIGLNILYQRRLHGYSQEELANRAGISRSRLSGIERGNITMTLETLLKIADEMDIELALLLHTEQKNEGPF